MDGRDAQHANTDCTDENQWRPVDGLMIEEIGEEVLVLDKKAGRIHQFNHVAGMVWRGLMQAQAPGEIAESIAERFEVPDFRARQDAIGTIEQLRILKLITAEVAD